MVCTGTLNDPPPKAVGHGHAAAIVFHKFSYFIVGNDSPGGGESTSHYKTVEFVKKKRGGITIITIIIKSRPRCARSAPDPPISAPGIDEGFGAPAGGIRSFNDPKQ